MKALKTLIGGVALTVALGACGGGGADSTTSADDTSATTTTSSAAAEEEPESGESTKVDVKEFAFTPARIEVKVGTRVVWTNGDAFRHTATSGATSGPENIPDGKFDEDLADKGSTGSYTFNEPGTFTYYCKQHNAMDGTVTVTA